MRQLIVNADDFGRSSSVNRAVARCHQEGILTSASLMVAGEAAEEAVALARSLPRLGVGLHLTLVRGRCTADPATLPGLVQPDGSFDSHPVRAGLRYFFQRDLRAALRREIEAQFAAFHRTGLPLDHVNGHLHIHLHPTVFSLLLGHLLQTPRPIPCRLPREPFLLHVRTGHPGRWAYRLSHALIFGLLTAWARPKLRRHRIPHTDRLFGLLETGRIDIDYLLRLLTQLPEGTAELYTHPDENHAPHEVEALTNPQVRSQIQAAGIKLIRYADL